MSEFTEGNDIFTINKGKYQGTQFRYGRVSIEEDQENDRLLLKFDYDIVESDVEIDGDEFMQIAGEILADLLSEGEIKKYEKH